MEVREMVAKFNRLVIIPKMIRVSALIKMWQVSIRKMGTITPTSTAMSYIEMAVRWIDAQYCAVPTQVRAFVASWLPMMRMPCPVSAPIMVGENQFFATRGTLPSLPVPSLLYSVARKPYRITSIPVKGGWEVKVPSGFSG